ncbi:hypothetical protein [Ferviditalea candida]|uniref:NIPSNAP domain-containing protein n=1 Tax=Ferviditalea candida TaxID=3108399 RepID=A0ABU5ZCU3_9BACL|nr:hypothetical protein [Paenibacillaceae bacterium T2]
MNKAFVEYRIQPEYRNDYFSFIRARLEQHSNMEAYEGADQPGLFVEVWDGLTEEQFRELQTVRRDPYSSWGELDRFMAGGLQKLNIWLFSPIQKE